MGWTHSFELINHHEHSGKAKNTRKLAFRRYGHQECETTSFAGEASGLQFNAWDGSQRTLTEAAYYYAFLWNP